MAGRQSTFSEEIAEEIYGRLIDGESLRKICTSADMPDRRTVMRWMEADPLFASRCARARVLQADLMDDLILDTADKTNSENAAASRVKISAYQWRAAKLAPKKYGDRVAHVGGGPDDEPIRHALDLSKLDDADLDALEGVLLKAGKTTAADADGD